MAVNNQPLMEGVINCGSAQFTSADTTTKKTIFTFGANGSRVDSISLCSNDTAAIVMNFYLTNPTGPTEIYYGNVTIAIGAGYTTVAKQDAIRVISSVIGFIQAPTGWLLKCACNATMTAAKTCDVLAMGGDFTQ